MVRCADCGFLSLRNLSRELCEADAITRETGHVPNGLAPKPECFRFAFRLPDEMKSDDSPEILRVIRLDRECGQFFPWERGNSPKEHRRMQYETQLREWQERQQAENARRQAERDQEQRNWQQQENRRSRRTQIVMTIVTLVLGAVLTIVGGLVQKKLGP